jgi:protein gp37
MGENTSIEWATHTMNFWLGCTKLSPACEHCYAESWAKRIGRPELWAGDRQRTTEANWRKPLKWNRETADAIASWQRRRAAGEAGDLWRPERLRVFTNSLADFFDNRVPPVWRMEAWRLIHATASLDWLVLTKRPQNIRRMLPDERLTEAWGDGWPNVWVGTTVEDRARLKNIDHLRAIPAAIRFLSIEPLLEDLGEIDLRGIHWVIVGGESGPHARPMHPDWVRAILGQCEAAGVPFLFKQWGEWAPTSGVDTYSHGPDKRRRQFPTSDGMAWLADGRICLKDFPVAEHQRRLREGEAVSTRAIEIDRDALTDFYASVKDEHRVRDNPLGYQWMYRVGKKAAGRVFDGRTHDGFPSLRREAVG